MPVDQRRSIIGRAPNEHVAREVICYLNDRFASLGAICQPYGNTFEILVPYARTENLRESGALVEACRGFIAGYSGCNS